jgi:hypothetical protein
VHAGGRSVLGLGFRVEGLEFRPVFRRPPGVGSSASAASAYPRQ